MDFPKTFSLTENQFSGKTYFYTIGPWALSLVRLAAEDAVREDGVEADDLVGPAPAVPSDAAVGVELVAEEGLLAVPAHPHLEAIV